MPSYRMDASRANPELTSRACGVAGLSANARISPPSQAAREEAARPGFQFHAGRGPVRTRASSLPTRAHRSRIATGELYVLCQQLAPVPYQPPAAHGLVSLLLTQIRRSALSDR